MKEKNNERKLYESILESKFKKDGKAILVEKRAF